MAKKAIAVVGWSLIGLIVVAFAAVMLIATFSGEGATPVKLIPGGRGGSQFPVAAIPLLVSLLIVLFFWLRRVFRRRALGSSPNKALQPTSPLTRRRG
jgi:uncharacterized membrane protein